MPRKQAALPPDQTDSPPNPDQQGSPDLGFLLEHLMGGGGPDLGGPSLALGHPTQDEGGGGGPPGGGGHGPGGPPPPPPPGGGVVGGPPAPPVGFLPPSPPGGGVVGGPAGGPVPGPGPTPPLPPETPAGPPDGGNPNPNVPPGAQQPPGPTDPSAGTPLGIPGTFALPGSPGARPFRTTAFFANHSPLAFGPGVPAAGGASQAMSDDDLIRMIADRTAGQGGGF